MSPLFSLVNSIQQMLFPFIEENIGVLSEKERQFVRIAELAAIDKHLKEYRWAGYGRKPKSRKAIALAFIAKAVWNFPTTKVLIEYLRASQNLRRLCGWESISEIPSKATFSRAFEQFSRENLAGVIHNSMLSECYDDRLVCHMSRDATAIESREKPAKKVKVKAGQPKRRGRRKKGETSREPVITRLNLQVGRDLKENLKDLPNQCDIGTKTNSKGHKTSWIGYKLHLDVADGDIPISAVLTSASTHDSQVAIPLMQMTSNRVTYLYELADSAYDAAQIEGYSRLLGHVPIIDQNKRRGEIIPMEPAKKVRFRQRSSAERVNSNLKDNYGGNFVRVKGAAKVMCHLMFGILALTASQLFKLIE